MTGRVPSARSMERFTARSSTDLFQVGTCWDARKRAPRAQPPRVGQVLGVDVEAEGSLCPHHIATDG